MLLFGKLVDETQMGNPRDHAVRDIASKFSIFLPLRAIYFRSYRYETPCTKNEILFTILYTTVDPFRTPEDANQTWTNQTTKRWIY